MATAGTQAEVATRSHAPVFRRQGFEQAIAADGGLSDFSLW